MLSGCRLQLIGYCSGVVTVAICLTFTLIHTLKLKSHKLPNSVVSRLLLCLFFFSLSRHKARGKVESCAIIRLVWRLSVSSCCLHVCHDDSSISYLLLKEEREWYSLIMKYSDINDICVIKVILRQYGRVVYGVSFKRCSFVGSNPTTVIFSFFSCYRQRETSEEILKTIHSSDLRSNNRWAGSF